MIDEIIIMGHNGKILFYNSYIDNKVNYNLLPGFFTALQQFAETLLSTDLREIKFQDKTYVFIKEEISIAARINEHHITDQSREIVSTIMNKFTERFRLLKDYSGDIDIFNAFEDDLAQLLPNLKPKISSQELLKQIFGLEVDGKKILTEL